MGVKEILRMFKKALKIYFDLINQIQPNPLKVFMSTFIILGTTSYQHNITQCKFLHALLHIIKTQDGTLLHYIVNIDKQ
jgi:hypothetical protein